MKKLIGLFCLLAFAGVLRADESDLVFNINRKIHYENAAVSASTQIIMVDISDTVNYPHPFGNAMAVSKVFLTANSMLGGSNISSGTMQLGVVTYVGNSTGTVEWFSGYSYYNTSSGTINYNDFVAPMYTRTYVQKVVNGDGVTPYFGTNSVTSGSSAYTVSKVLPTSLGTSSPPAIGDIILNINIFTGTIAGLSADVYYAGVRQ